MFLLMPQNLEWKKADTACEYIVTRYLPDMRGYLIGIGSDTDQQELVSYLSNLPGQYRLSLLLIN